MDFKKNLKDVEQKIELQMFDPKGRKPNASGGIAGQLHLNQGGRARFQDGMIVSPHTEFPTYDWGGQFYKDNPDPFTLDYDKWKAAYSQATGGGTTTVDPVYGNVGTSFGNWDPSQTYSRYVGDYHQRGKEHGDFWSMWDKQPEEQARMKAIMNAMYGTVGRGDPRDRPASTPVAEDTGNILGTGIRAAGQIVDPGKVASTAGKGMTTVYHGTTAADPFAGKKFFVSPEKATAAQYAKSGIAHGNPLSKAPVTGRILETKVPTSQLESQLKRGLTGTREAVLDPKAAKTLFETGKGALKGSASLGTKLALGATKALPIVGGGVALADAANRLRQGDYVGAGLGAVGSLPIVGIPALGAQAAWDYRDKISPYVKKFGSALGEKMASLREQRGIDPRMAATYAQNRQIMADPRMRGPMGAAKGGLAKILEV
jgi:hypothetical protein